MVGPSGSRAVARCDRLGVPPYSDREDGLYRGYLTPAHAAALEQLADWMAEAGMAVRLDPAANLIGRYEGTRADAPPLIIGSHIDSVRAAGRYDGPLGVMLGIECVAALHEQGRKPPFPVEVVAFGDEEGSRFPASMMCSRAFAGTLDPAALEVADADGVTLEEARRAFPGLPHNEGMLKAAHGRALAFIEPHIEQGPVLEAEGLAVGVVSGIAAQLRFEAVIEGIAGHAGTTAMSLRRDALAGAAEAILAVEAAARQAGGDVVATVGKLLAEPGAVNVVPGRVTFSIDVRASTEAARDQTAKDMSARIAAIAAGRGLTASLRQVQDLPASPCDPDLVKLMSLAVEETGQAPHVLMSGAGHDAMTVSALCPTAMLFVRCEGGVSHNPAEAVTAADADVALAVLRRFVDKLAETVHV